MTVRMRSNVEPFSVASVPNDPAAPQPVLAQSRAGVVLEHELRRYCQGQVRGRSFLVSGHRGAGKTTLVEHLLQHYQVEALNRRVALKPLPVHLLGPVLLPPVPAAERPPRRKAAAAAADGSDRLSDDQRVLIEVAQALHRAVALEYSQRFHRLALLRLEARHRDADDLAELAARFQIELTEAPPPARLLQFWRRAGALPHGLLFEPGDDRGHQQGWRELVALTGVSHLYQRISGQLTEKDEQTDSGSRQLQQSHGVDGKWADVVTALGTAGAGGTVAVAGLASGHPVAGGVIGLITALGAGLAVKLTTTRQMERKIDRTFVPDLSVKTLNRVMPELFDRLQAAGLAPVFVVDELDKVDHLLARIQSLLDHLKKLFAERSFTCLITDRGFYEALHLHERQEFAAAVGHGA